MRIGVAIPAFHSVRWIEATLRSLVAQDYEDWQCVVVIDGDDDGTCAAIERLADPRIRVVCDGIHRGQMGNFNRAILEVLAGSPNVVRLLSADDVLYPYALSDILRVFDCHPDVGLVSAHFDIIDAQGALRFTVDLSEREDLIMSGSEYLWKGVAVGNTLGGPSSVALRASALEDSELFDTAMNYAGDQDLWHRIAARWSVAWVGRRAGFQYRQHDDSVTHRDRASTSRFADKIHSVRRVSKSVTFLGWRWWLLQYTIGWLHAINLQSIGLMILRGDWRSARIGIRVSWRQGFVFYAPFWAPRLPWQIMRGMLGKDPFRRTLWRRVHESLQPARRPV